MNRLNKLSRAWLLPITLATNSGVAATLPSDWQKEQRFEVAVPGLTKINLPAETIDASRPGFVDLRLHDDNGTELPYLIERPRPMPKVVRGPASFYTSLESGRSVIKMRTAFLDPIEAVTFDTPATRFIKPVKVEGSSDGTNWQTLARGVPIFSENNGARQLRIVIPKAVWPWLRFTVDDARSQPIPVTGVKLHAATAEVPPTETFNATLVEHHQNLGVTRLTIDLGAANLDVASVQIEATDPLFSRRVTLAVPQVFPDAIREQTLGEGTIRRGANADTNFTNLAIPLERQVIGRQLLLLIHNGDSPPLTITGVRVERRPAYLVFMARAPGIHHLATGNPRCDFPHYDLASFGTDFKSLPVSAIQLAAIAQNPNYRPPEALPGIEIDGAPLDVSAWKYRKAIKLTRSGAQELELDLDVLSHAQQNFQDLRLMRDGKQVPYVIERTSISCALAVTAIASNDPNAPKDSLWKIKLAQSNLPITRLSCVSASTLFSRVASLYEEIPDDRGQLVRRSIANASWRQTPEYKNNELVLMVDQPPETEDLTLVVQNGDNPPISLQDFRIFHPVTRLLFKAKVDDEVMLYYGNPNTSSPQYDLNLVANQLLAADKSAATLVTEQQLKRTSWEHRISGKGGVVFWGILAVVVVGLLAIISRLLPKETPP